MNPNPTKTARLGMFLILFFCSHSAIAGNTFVNVQSAFTTSLNSKSFIPLPLTLVQFTAVKNQSGKIEIMWKTAQEINVSHFNIERSTDGRKWKKIGEKSARGQLGAIELYGFTDITPSKESNYYRLHIVDFDGHSDYSPVRFITVGDVTSVKIYPTLASAGTPIYVEGISPENAQVEIFTHEGRPVQKFKLYANTFSIGNLSSGFYHVRVSNVKTGAIVSRERMLVY